MTYVMYHYVISGSCLRNRGYVSNRDVFINLYSPSNTHARTHAHTRTRYDVQWSEGLRWNRTFRGHPTAFNLWWTQNILLANGDIFLFLTRARGMMCSVCVWWIVVLGLNHTHLLRQGFSYWPEIRAEVSQRYRLSSLPKGEPMGMCLYRQRGFSCMPS